MSLSMSLSLSLSLVFILRVQYSPDQAVPVDGPPLVAGRTLELAGGNHAGTLALIIIIIIMIMMIIRILMIMMVMSEKLALLEKGV